MSLERQHTNMSQLCTKSRLLSRRSRRLKIAQHFSAGRASQDTLQSVKRTVELSQNFNRPLHGLIRSMRPNPALKCWAISVVPLRGTVFGLFVQSHSKQSVSQ